MGDHQKRDEWLQDIKARQRNFVFPDTLQNETRFWRNLGKGPSSTAARAGLIVLAIFVLGVAAIFLVATYEGGVLWEFLLGMLLFCGTGFGVIAWATRRNLRDVQESRRGQRTRKN
jgi:hypothetical protein